MSAKTIQEYVELGGLQRGYHFWTGWNFSWPMATLRASAERIEIKVKVFWLEVAAYEFSRQEILALEKYRGLFSTGILIRHNKKSYPPFMLFWTLNYRACKAGLELVNYQVGEPI